MIYLFGRRLSKRRGGGSSFDIDMVGLGFKHDYGGGQKRL